MIIEYQMQLATGRRLSVDDKPIICCGEFESMETFERFRKRELDRGWRVFGEEEVKFPQVRTTPHLEKVAAQAEFGAEVLRLMEQNTEWGPGSAR